MIVETETFNLPLWLMIIIPFLLLGGIVVWDRVSCRGWKYSGPLLIGLLSFLLIMAGLVWFDFKNVKRAQDTPLKTELVGTFDRAEYARQATVICLTDGRVYILDGRHQVPFQKGAKIEILKNKGLIKIVEKK